MMLEHVATAERAAGPFARLRPSLRDEFFEAAYLTLVRSAEIAEGVCGSFAGYVANGVRNRCRDVLRERVREARRVDSGVVLEQIADDEPRPIHEEVERLLARLTEGEREFVYANILTKVRGRRLSKEEYSERRRIIRKLQRLAGERGMEG